MPWHHPRYPQWNQVLILEPSFTGCWIQRVHKSPESPIDAKKLTVNYLLVEAGPEKKKKKKKIPEDLGSISKFSDPLQTWAAVVLGSGIELLC